MRRASISGRCRPAGRRRDRATHRPAVRAHRRGAGLGATWNGSRSRALARLRADRVTDRDDVLHACMSTLSSRADWPAAGSAAARMDRVTRVRQEGDHISIGSQLDQLGRVHCFLPTSGLAFAVGADFSPRLSKTTWAVSRLGSLLFGSSLIVSIRKSRWSVSTHLRNSSISAKCPSSVSLRPSVSIGTEVLGLFGLQVEQFQRRRLASGRSRAASAR